MNETPQTHVESWEKLLEKYREDHEELERRRKLDEARPVAIPSILDCLAAFLAEETSVEELKVEYDKRTRTEWNYFGLKGPSGAMFLNTLVIHLRAQFPRRPVEKGTAKTSRRGNWV